MDLLDLGDPSEDHIHVVFAEVLAFDLTTAKVQLRVDVSVVGDATTPEASEVHVPGLRNFPRAGSPPYPRETGPHRRAAKPGQARSLERIGSRSTSKRHTA